MERSAGQKKKETHVKSIILCFLLVANVLLPVAAQTSQTRFLKHLAVQDLEYLREAIINVHPHPFVYTTEAEFNRVVDNEIATLKDTVAYYELRNAARRIVYYIHDVHSTVLSRKITNKEALLLSDRYFPLEVRWIGDDFYVYENFSDDTLIKPGFKLHSINHHHMPEIIDSIRKYRSGDGPEDDFIRGLVNLPYQFNLLFDLHYPEDDFYITEYYDSLGFPHTDTLAAIYEPTGRKREKDTVVYDYQSKFKNINLKFIDDDIAYLRVEDFDGLQGNHFHYCFKLIEKQKSSNLILDLRYNYGGGMDNANNLISYIIDSTYSFSLETPVKTKSFEYYDLSGMLARIGGIFYFMIIDKGAYVVKDGNWYWQMFIEPKKHYNFNGNLYVLINEHSLSAASYVGSQLKHRAGAILVGRPSGGGEYGNAGYTYTTFTLPNSNSKVKVPHNWVSYDIQHGSEHELYPDHIVHPDIYDFLEKRDVSMEKVLYLIRHPR